METPLNPDGLAAELRDLGVRDGDLLMVHASIRSIGPVDGGPDALGEALVRAVGPAGSLMGYAAWDRSPYDETLNGRRLDPGERDRWPAFDPRTAGVYPGFGFLNAVLCSRPDARRSAHPDASMVATGPLAAWLTEPHLLGHAFGPGSPLERFVARGGRVLLLGAGPDSVTVLHYAEAIADIPGKRRVTYEMPLRTADGGTAWTLAEDYDSNGILDCYAGPGPDAVERITTDYMAEGRHRQGPFGRTTARLFEADDLVAYGVAWLEARHGGERSE